MAPRNIARVDDSQEGIVAALRGIGAIVTSLHQMGHGVPDLLVSYRDQWYVAEVKTDRGKLTEDQETWISKQRAKVHVWRNPGEALYTLTREDYTEELA